MSNYDISPGRSLGLQDYSLKGKKSSLKVKANLFTSIYTWHLRIIIFFLVQRRTRVYDCPARTSTCQHPNVPLELLPDVPAFWIKLQVWLLIMSIPILKRWLEKKLKTRKLFVIGLQPVMAKWLKSIMKLIAVKYSDKSEHKVRQIIFKDPKCLLGLFESIF